MNMSIKSGICIEKTVQISCCSIFCFDLLTHETVECDFGFSVVLCTCIRCLRAHLMWRCFIHRSFTLMIQRSIKPTESACYAGWLYVGLCVCVCACIWTLTDTSVCCTESELRWTLTVCLTHSSVNQHTF